jgi:hypothetical protein
MLTMLNVGSAQPVIKQCSPRVTLRRFLHVKHGFTGNLMVFKIAAVVGCAAVLRIALRLLLCGGVPTVRLRPYSICRNYRIT